MLGRKDAAGATRRRVLSRARLGAGEFFAACPRRRLRVPAAWVVIGGMLLVLSTLLPLAGCGGAQRPALLVGAVEDAAKWDPPLASMERARGAGFGVIVLSAVWTAPERAPGAGQIAQLRRAVVAAEATRIVPIVAVYSFARSTPLTAAGRLEFVAYASALLRSLPTLRYMSIGNEPNSGVFWMPQFSRSGADVAASSYYALLAQAYRALKAIEPRLTVIGGSLASRGSDRPGVGMPSHSPVAFIEALGRAFRASHARRLPMDIFSLHPYPANSSIPPTVVHKNSTTIGIADYPRLVSLLSRAFGAPPPIIYGEYGINTVIPVDKRRFYEGHRPPSIDPVSATTQAEYYVEAIKLAACQPLVRMLLFFHVTDEPRLTGLQSGVFYADNTPKRSLAAVARWARRAQSRQVACR